MRFYFRTGRGTGVSLGPIGLAIVGPFILMAYGCWLMLVGLYWLFVFLVRAVVILAPLVWSLLVLVWALVLDGWAYLRARSRRPASE